MLRELLAIDHNSRRALPISSSKSAGRDALGGALTMHTPMSSPLPGSSASADLRLGYLWTIAFVAALGGLLFGYDWVVIGGAKPFYEMYFHLTSAALIAWANSCALLGCFAGSLIAGPAADKFGRKKLLVISAVLFAVSSVFTGMGPHLQCI